MHILEGIQHTSEYSGTWHFTIYNCRSYGPQIVSNASPPNLAAPTRRLLLCQAIRRLHLAHLAWGGTGSRAPNWFDFWSWSTSQDRQHLVRIVGRESWSIKHWCAMKNRELSTISLNTMVGIPTGEQAITNHEAIKYDWSTTSQLVN